MDFFASRDDRLLAGDLVISRTALSSAFAFVIASPMPMFTTTLCTWGTCMTF